MYGDEAANLLLVVVVVYVGRIVGSLERLL